MRVLPLLLLSLVVLSACHRPASRNLIVIGVDGMDPGFVERHWADLPNLNRLRETGHFSRLATTTPPQSPVAWSTFITGIDPADHGIFDFVHRDPHTHELFLSTDRTTPPRFQLTFGPWELPLSRSHVESLRHGRAFWQVFSERGIPVSVVRMPTNYPPLSAGTEIAGMGTPDLRGTQGTFAFYTDDPRWTSQSVAGGLIRQVAIVNHHVDLRIEGPPNSLRKDHEYSSIAMTVDIDPEHSAARLAVGDDLYIVQQGEWSDWIPAEFPLLPHAIYARGMFRVFAKHLHPGFELYVSPINVDPRKAALPISHPESFARDLGPFYTLGIAEDTSALRAGVFDLPEFLAQSRLVLRDEQRLLRELLRRYTGGLLFFYFSAVDQNSHILWGKYDTELLRFYRAVDASIGEVMRSHPEAELVVMSDHGFSTFRRAVNLNTWLLQQGLLTRDATGGIDWTNTKAYAMGLNALYLSGANREDLRRRLLSWRDPENGQPVIESLRDVHAAPENRSIAPDLIVGYRPGYRASWETGLGEVPDTALEDNAGPWIADHCIDASEVPGVLFLSEPAANPPSSLKDLSHWLVQRLDPGKTIS